MLHLKQVTVECGPVDAPQTLLRDITLTFPPGHLAAVVGPSGCGKSTLLKTIAGLLETVEGSVYWQNRDLAEEEDLAPCELGYVPQFSIFHENLTVWECVYNACRLRVAGLSRPECGRRVTQILRYVGLDDIAERRARHLSGGQRRRLGLALELVSNPALLLCDEVTSGLDPKAEDEIVRLMRHLASGNRTVLNVTHSLRHLALYDSVTVLYRGVLAYQGPAAGLLDYFAVANAEDVFPRLCEYEPEVWQERYREYAPLRSDWLLQTAERTTNLQLPGDKEERPEPAGFLIQIWIMFVRRWQLFFRDQGQLWLHVSLLVIFPLIVVVFAYNGLPQIQNMSMGGEGSIVQELRERIQFSVQTTQVGSLVSGLIMFQVVLLTLMGSNNSAREVAAERLIFEKEKLGGLEVGSYLAGKVAYLFFLVAAQAAGMMLIVKGVCHLPGDPVSQGLVLFLADLAMTLVCLGISAWSRTTEQASLISIYLVGFQLPLSGAVLALPEFLGTLVRPFIAAYWSWSGYLQSMQDTRFYDLVSSITLTPMAAVPVCVWVLLFHLMAGVSAAWMGCSRSQWD